MERASKTLCIAHRGARTEAPDNTRAAFERALKYPIDGIELDVQMTADGVPVLFHDDTLRLVGGGNRQVADLPLDRLQALNWGGWFHPDFAGEPLMTLEQLLPFIERCPRLLIEIKSDPKEQSSGHAYRLTEKVIAMITKPEYGAWQNRLHILSFDPQVLLQTRELAPGLKTVLNLSGREPIETMDTVPDLWAIDVEIANLTDIMVQRARDRGLQILSYTCNGPRQVSKALGLGIDGIISDRPDWLTRYLASR